MLNRLPLAALLTALAVPVAADCPPAPDHSAAFADLTRQLQAAENELAAAPINTRMWELWTDAPNEQAQAVLDRGMQRRSSHDLLGAITDFTTLIEYCPQYAEGYNQRAFAHFIQGRHELAAIDLLRALELSPNHVGARSGLGLTYMQMGRKADARRELNRALEINPWLSERHYMAKGGPLAPDGDDI